MHLAFFITAASYEASMKDNAAKSKLGLHVHTYGGRIILARHSSIGVWSRTTHTYLTLSTDAIRDLTPPYD